MAYKIVWAPKAVYTFDAIISYLQDCWTEKQIKYLVERTGKTINLISLNPYLFRVSEKENIHEVVITKHNLLYYQINSKEKTIELLAFFDTRQHPQKKLK